MTNGRPSPSGAAQREQGREQAMIQLTEAAAKEIRKAKTEGGLGEDVPIRIGIKGGGCSGFTYTFDFVANKGKFDLEFDSQGMKILVDKKSHLYIDGTVVDWSYSLMDRGLKFTNPSAKGSCGCGTSFIYEPQKTPTDLPAFELKF
jgi:iron-sulfur cluster assembly accessory protein